jgi:hypothetical protein
MGIKKNDSIKYEVCDSYPVVLGQYYAAVRLTCYQCTPECCEMCSADKQESEKKAMPHTIQRIIAVHII